MVDLFFTSRAEEEHEKGNDQNSARKKFSQDEEEEEIEKASPNKHNNNDDDDELEREDQEERVELGDDDNFDLAFGDNNAATRDTIISKAEPQKNRSHRYEVMEDEDATELQDIQFEQDQPEIKEEVKKEEPSES